jgi:hypothetical protein
MTLMLPYAASTVGAIALSGPGMHLCRTQSIGLLISTYI